ncbi:MAG: Tyrosine-protein kinase MasK [Deltaproteobacteria bacterium ADurb.Bin207]|jgi:serine/threonine-protein kinase|nr:MAG: Tyrosine-protein kinase MasK [Deltaproteobacteria bacterium ADurb.Bin207]
MADVYAGCVRGEAGFERVVAIKRMASALAQDEEFVAMFLHEARLAAQIRSVHVVQTLDLGRDHEGVPYLVMDLVVGATASRLIKRAAERSLPIPVDVVLSIIQDTCQGLHDAHEAVSREGNALGIVHRDVSPHNILIGEDGGARVADFGISKAFDSSTDATRDHMRGKLAYFSPEQARGDSLDRRSDVFSAGIVAWEMLTGLRLFRAELPVRTLSRVLYGPIEPVNSWRKEVPEPVARVVERALERDLSARYATAMEFASALRKAALEAGIEPQRSAVSEFLVTCCEAEIEHIRALLRSRTSWRPDSPMPSAAPRSEPSLRLDETAPDPLFSSKSEPVTQPFAMVQGQSGTFSAQLPRPRAKRLAVALALLALLGAIAAILVIAPKGTTPAVSSLSVVQGPPTPPSVRPVLRIGTSFFRSIPSSPLAPAVFWSLIEPSTDGRAKAIFVRQRPSLENGLARILPGGRVEVRWELLPGLRWSDGTLVRADDLLISHTLMPSSRVLDARRIDESIAVLVWSDHWAEAVEGVEPLAASVLEPHLQSEGGQAAREYRNTYPTPGLGPYRIAEVRVGEWMVLEPNPYFAGPPPSMSRIELRCTQDTTKLVESFERGDVDLIVPNAITVDDAEALAKRRPDAVHFRASPHYVLVQPDMNHPLLASLEVRKALLSAIDRGKLTSKLYNRTDLIAHCPAVGLGPGDVATYPFHRARALAELERLKVKGVTFPLFHSHWAMDVRIATMLRDDLQAAGLKITLSPVDHVSDLVRNGHHGGLALYSLRDVGPDSVAAHFNIPMVGTDYDLSVRHSGFDEGVASLLEREQRAMDPLRRSQLLRELWVAYAERLPTLPLAFLLERVVVDPHLRGWDGSPFQRFGADMERWYFVQ